MIAPPRLRAPSTTTVLAIGKEYGSARRRLQAGLESIEQRPELLDLVVAELRAQQPVVAQGDRAQPVEQLDPGVGELGPLDAAIVVLAPPPHEALALECVQMVGQRRPGDPELLGHLR